MSDALRPGSESGSYGSRRNLVQRRRGGSSVETDRSGQQMFLPGTPIGYLAARGTPYEKKYFSRKLGFCCLFIAPPTIIITLVITLVPVLWAIARHALHTSQLHVYDSNITSPGNTSFPLTIEGQVKKTGIFPARLYFRKPVYVYWNTPPPNMRELQLGHFNLAYIGAAAGHARVKQATTFEIDDVDGFSTFSKWLISMPEFTWQLRCAEVHAEAFSFFPTYKSLTFTKDVVFNGIDGFHDVKILDLQLPGDDPAGGIQAIALTSLTNPSPFGVEVGTLNLDLFYKDLYLGPVQATNLNLTTGKNTIKLFGRVKSYANDQGALDILGELFTNYINSVTSMVEARGVSTQQADGSTVGWLAAGITALTVQIPFVPPKPIDPIKGIVIEYISLIYSTETPYNPILFSNALQGTLILPFGFSLDVIDLATQLNIYTNGALVGSVYGDYGTSSTTITTRNEGTTAGNISLTLPPSQLVLPNSTDAAKQQLIAFQDNFVYNDQAGFTTQGKAKAISDTPVGRILLNGINFNVSTGLIGLSGLTRYPTIINSVDVTGGAPDAVSLTVGTTVVNPSNLNLSTGDTTFQLINTVPLGNVTLPALNLKPGRNDVAATSFFDPNRDPKGLETLNRFISGLDTQLNISGFSGSSPIASLEPTLLDIRLNSTLPGLKARLVQAANLTVLDTTGITDDVADSHVELYNPFTAGLTITRITANASSHGIFIANIDTPLQFTANGKAVTTSPVVPLSLNLYPPDLFALVRALAVQSGQDPAYIDGIVNLGGFTLSATTSQNGGTATRRKRDVADEDVSEQMARDTSFTYEDDSGMSQMLMGAGSNPGMLVDADDLSADDTIEEESDGVAKRAMPLVYDNSNKLTKRDNLYTGFDLPTYVGKAFAVATADLTIVSDAVIGQYGTTLTFSQNDVPLGTDATLFKLLPVLALPIVQRIVDGSILNIDRVTITEAAPMSFTAQLEGSLTNAGPFDGTVMFPEGLTIYWEGQALTSTAFPNIALVADLGSSINVQVEGQIPNVDYFTQFLKYTILNPTFVWNIRGSGITVDALGIRVPNITINKDVQLTGLNGLKGQVIINSFDVPYNDPAGGLHLTAVSTINNPAQVGVALTQFGTEIFMGSTDVGPAAAANAFTLQALATTVVPLAGRIQQQTSAQGLADLSEIFTRFVHNQNSNLLVNGVYAGPSDVVWLNEGIKALSVQVALPAQDFQVIRLVSINQLSLFFTVPSAYGPNTDSSDTEAHFFLPFAFPVDITQITGPFNARYSNTQMAVLNIPASPATTNVEQRILTLMFTNVPFSVFGNAHEVFNNFVADVTREKQVTFNLNGMATSTTNTAAGVLTIADIPFNLNTNILGLQNLNARPANVSDLDVVHGYPTYLLITVMTTLYNPSDITIGAGDVTFAVLFQNNLIGSAIIRNILLVPGENTVPTEIDYMPMGATNVASGQLLLENYVQNVTSDTIVAGTTQTTPIDSLKKALGGISLTAAIPPLEKLIVIEAALEVPKNIAQTGIAMASVMIANPFTASINILQLMADANFEGITVGTINQDLAATNNIIHAPGKQTTTSQQIPININIDPKALIRFIEAAAATYGVSLGPLPPYFQMVLDLDDTTTTIMPYPDDSTPPCNSGKAFDTLGAILALLKPLQTSIPIQSTLKIDDYQTDLDFIQQPVPTKTDATALYLVGPAGAPLIQLIVNASTLTVTQANATSLTDAGFTAALAGSLMVDSPADAYIEFPDPVIINWQGQDIAEIALPPLCSEVPDGIPNLMTTGQLTIINEDGFEAFTYYLLTEPNFQWILHSNTVVVRALQIKFSDVILVKPITLDAFNGLPGIRITSFEAPSDGPGPRINIETTAAIPSPAALGVELDQATFDLYFQGSNIGQASSNNLFLAAKTTTAAPLAGYLRDESNNAQGLKNIGILFSQFLAGKDSTLSAHGNQVVTAANNNRPVRWLTNAFKRFSTDVILPGHIYQIIYSITLSDLEVTVDNNDMPYMLKPVSNNMTTAVFSNPFGFGLQPTSAGPHITITYDGVDTASLILPLDPVTAGTSRGPNDKQDLILNFKDQTLNSLNDPSFQAFFAKLADTDSGTFGLKGSTDVIAKTAIGSPTITGIPFNVTTSLVGVNSFNHEATLMNVAVDAPTSQNLGIHLDAILNNPSNISLTTDRVSLPTVYLKNGQSIFVGCATIANLVLVPGQNNVSTLFEIPESNVNNPDVEEVLQRYVQPTDFMSTDAYDMIPLDILGTAGNGACDLSPYQSLDPALAGIEAKATLKGISSPIVDQIRVYLDYHNLAGLFTQTLLQAANFTLPAGLNLSSVLGNLPGFGDVGDPNTVYAYITSQNDLPSQLDINRLVTSIFDYESDPEDHSRIAHFDHTFDTPYSIPAAPVTKPANPPKKASSLIPNIILDKGLVGTIPDVGHNLDIENVITAGLSSAKSPGRNDFNIPSLKYIQKNVPTIYCVYFGTDQKDQCDLNISGIGDLTDLLNMILGNAQLIDGLLSEVGPIISSVIAGLTDGANAGVHTLTGALAGLCSVAGLGDLCRTALSISAPTPTSLPTSLSLPGEASAAASNATAAAGSVISTVTSLITEELTRIETIDVTIAGLATVSLSTILELTTVTSLIPTTLPAMKRDVRATPMPTPTPAAVLKRDNIAGRAMQGDPEAFEAVRRLAVHFNEKVQEGEVRKREKQRSDHRREDSL